MNSLTLSEVLSLPKGARVVMCCPFFFQEIIVLSISIGADGHLILNFTYNINGVNDCEHMSNYGKNWSLIKS